jgi:hypothetical protein
VDDHLRALERRWRETGAEDDHARWLQERVRCGELLADDALDELAAAEAARWLDQVERERACEESSSDRQAGDPRGRGPLETTFVWRGSRARGMLVAWPASSARARRSGGSSRRAG